MGLRYALIQESTMKAIAIASLIIITATGASALDFEGATEDAVRVATDASTGLEAVYVLPSTQGVTMGYDAKGDGTVRWYRFSNMGGAYAEEISCTRSGNRVTAPAQNGDMGYIIEDSGTRTCYWVTDYSAHEFRAEALGFSGEQTCSQAELTFTGEGGDIAYYTINGRRMVLSRELELEYSTLVFDEETFVYNQQTVTKTLASAGNTIYTDAPLCDTGFTLSGDRFLHAWNRSVSVASGTYTAIAVEAQSRATQETRDNDNEIKDSADGLGGSAPCDIAFEAIVTDAAVFREWQISRSPEFDINDNTFSELTFDYTFRENGTRYVRFVANNVDGTCEYTGPVYEINIGESQLDIPNAFSPEGSPGVNDEWKVSYKSLVSYECHIFNRWGKELFASTDPAQGWDGKQGGKYVPAGVYFYVIKAMGADGRRYEKAGDINIINYRQEAAGVSGDSAQ